MVLTLELTATSTRSRRWFKSSGRSSAGGFGAGRGRAGGGRGWAGWPQGGSVEAPSACPRSACFSPSASLLSLRLLPLSLRLLPLSLRLLPLPPVPPPSSPPLPPPPPSPSPSLLSPSPSLLSLLPLPPSLQTLKGPPLTEWSCSTTQRRSTSSKHRECDESPPTRPTRNYLCALRTSSEWMVVWRGRRCWLTRGTYGRAAEATCC